MPYPSRKEIFLKQPRSFGAVLFLRLLVKHMLFHYRIKLLKLQLLFILGPLAVLFPLCPVYMLRLRRLQFNKCIL